VNYAVIPSVIYTAPEIAWVGQTEEQLKAAGIDYKSGVFPFAASGRARAMEAAVGFREDSGSARLPIPFLACTSSVRWPGELIAEATLAMEFQASAEDLQRTIHAHPTLAEALHEAALAADKRAIDIINR
jgi:dihydrolipoamide dehydrogenase